MSIKINLVQGEGYLKLGDIDLSMYATKSIIVVMDALGNQEIIDYLNNDDRKKNSGCFIINSAESTIENAGTGVLKNYYSVVYKTIKVNGTSIELENEVYVGFICDTASFIQGLHGVDFNAAYRICSLLSRDNYIYCVKDKDSVTADVISKGSVMYMDDKKVYLYTTAQDDSDDLIGVLKNTGNFIQRKPSMISGRPAIIRYEKFNETGTSSNWYNKWVNYEYLLSCLDDTTTALTITKSVNAEIQNFDSSKLKSAKVKIFNSENLTKLDITPDSPSGSIYSGFDKLKKIYSGNVTASTLNPRIGDNVTIQIEPNGWSTIHDVEFENCSLIYPTSTETPEWKLDKSNFTIDVIGQNPKITVTFGDKDKLESEVEKGINEQIDFSNYATKGDISTYIPFNELIANGHTYHENTYVNINLENDITYSNIPTTKPESYGYFKITKQGETVEKDNSNNLRNYYLVQYVFSTNTMIEYQIGFIINVDTVIQTLANTNSINENAIKRVGALLEDTPYIKFYKEETGSEINYIFGNTSDRIIKMKTGTGTDDYDVIGKFKDNSVVVKSKPITKINDKKKELSLVKYKEFNSDDWNGKYVNYDYLLSCLDDTTTELTWNVEYVNDDADRSIKLTKLVEVFNPNGALQDFKPINGSVTVSNKHPRIGDNVIVTIIPNEGSMATINTSKNVNCRVVIPEQADLFGKIVATLDITGENPKFEVTFTSADAVNTGTEGAQNSATMEVVEGKGYTTMSAVEGKGYALNTAVTALDSRVTTLNGSVTTLNGNLTNVAKKALGYPVEKNINFSDLVSYNDKSGNPIITYDTSTIKINGTSGYKIYVIGEYQTQFNTTLYYFIDSGTDYNSIISKKTFTFKQCIAFYGKESSNGNITGPSIGTLSCGDILYAKNANGGMCLGGTGSAINYTITKGDNTITASVYRAISFTIGSENIQILPMIIDSIN